ncbi:4Fe-4S ferredoxin [Campylobacter ureolyticus]|uniref:4Fe-4S ferredoxin n=1 Tax=Campylobacter ureolyticus TaxID=827 RepID=UPI0022B30C3B|nr:4Fe-4S ferredoxin [Campylobacter ureolyticus]MCZ6132545.1 4Fe-4S ferredoxin [Campylobacter ureolyticus]
MLKRFQKTIYPPYFSGKFECLECKAPCVTSCDKNLIKLKENFVYFEPNEFGCDFCKKCAIACQENQKNTLNLDFGAKINAVAKIEITSCLAWNNTICYNCYEVCKFKAIEYFGVFKPTINKNCIGCGECVGACFKEALSLKGVSF